MRRVLEQRLTHTLIFLFQLWIFTKFVEGYLRLLYPLKKYDMVPSHSFLDQISSCKFMATPAKFYDRVREGSLIPKKSQSFSFCKNGLILDKEATPLATDIVIFATGFKSDEKLKSLFASTYFQDCIFGSSTPFYRHLISVHNIFRFSDFSTLNLTTNYVMF